MLRSKEVITLRPHHYLYQVGMYENRHLQIYVIDSFRTLPSKTYRTIGTSKYGTQKLILLGSQTRNHSKLHSQKYLGGIKSDYSVCKVSHDFLLPYQSMFRHFITLMYD